MQASNDTQLISSIYARSVSISIQVVCALVAVVSGSGNIFIIAAIVKSKTYRRPLYIMFINFNIADFLLSVFVVPVNIMIIASDGTLANNIVCSYTVYSTTLTITSSATSLCFIALYRVTQICYPKVYAKIKSALFVGFVITITWLPSGVLCGIFGHAVSFNPHYLACEFTGRHIYPLFLSLIFAPIALLILISYVKIFIHMRTSRKKVRPENTIESAILPKVSFGQVTGPIHSLRPIGKASKQGHPQSVKVLQTMTFIFIDFGLFYLLPILIFTFRDHIAPGSAIRVLMPLAFLLKKVRPLASLVLYFLSNPELREKVLLKMCHKDQPGNEKGRTRVFTLVDETTRRTHFIEQHSGNSKASSTLSVLAAKHLDISSEAGSTYSGLSVFSRYSNAHI